MNFYVCTFDPGRMRRPLLVLRHPRGARARATRAGRGRRRRGGAPRRTRLPGNRDNRRAPRDVPERRRDTRRSAGAAPRASRAGPPAAVEHRADALLARDRRSRGEKPPVRAPLPPAAAERQRPHPAPDAAAVHGRALLGSCPRDRPRIPEGTEAAELPDQVSSRVADERGCILRAISREKNLEFRRRFVGAVLSGLTLAAEEGMGESVVLTDNYIHARVRGLEIGPNRLVRIRVDAVEPDATCGSLVD